MNARRLCALIFALTLAIAAPAGANGIGGDPSSGPFDAVKGGWILGHAFTAIGTHDIYIDPLADVWTKTISIDLSLLVDFGPGIENGLPNGALMSMQEILNFVDIPVGDPLPVSNWHSLIVVPNPEAAPNDIGADLTWHIGIACWVEPCGDTQIAGTVSPDGQDLSYDFDPALVLPTLTLSQWVLYSGPSLLPTDGTVTFTIVQYDPLIVVPEPSTLLLLGLGIAGLGVLRSRKARRS